MPFKGRGRGVLGCWLVGFLVWFVGGVVCLVGGCGGSWFVLLVCFVVWAGDGGGLGLVVLFLQF
jgi:hypothetical protein